MEQIQNEMRANRGKLNALGKARAMELQMKAPQLMDDNMLEPTEPQPGVRGGGIDTRMARVVGSGKKSKKMKGGAMSLNDSMADEGDNMAGRTSAMKGGVMSGASNGRMVGAGSMKGGAKEMGEALGQQVLKLHGEGFFSDFVSGLTSVLKPVASVASFIPGPIGAIGRVASGIMGGAKPRKGCRGGAGKQVAAPPAGIEVEHAMMSPAEQGLPGMGTGGQDVPPGGKAPLAYGSPPQAPESFRRNTVGMGKGKAQMGCMGCKGKCLCSGGAKKMLGQTRKDKEDERLAMEIKGVKDKVAGGVPSGAGMNKRSARGAMVSKLMKERGMTLGEASKYIKENGGV